STLEVPKMILPEPEDSKQDRTSNNLLLAPTNIKSKLIINKKEQTIQTDHSKSKSDDSMDIDQTNNNQSEVTPNNNKEKKIPSYN
ncbi:19661_t:CDS:2, partial [Racocetra fulgida]